MTYSLQMYML